MTSRRTLLRSAAVLAVALFATACAEDEAPKSLSGYELTPPPSVAVRASRCLRSTA